MMPSILFLAVLKSSVGAKGDQTIIRLITCQNSEGFRIYFFSLSWYINAPKLVLLTKDLRHFTKLRK